MPAIVAPSPRLPRQHTDLLSQDPFALLSPSLPSSDKTIHSPPFFSPPPPRLLSPIRLHDIALSSKSPTPCVPSHKRRAQSRLSARSTRRRRHAQRVDCCPLDALGHPSIFDQLPWISALEMQSPVNSDIADLSQLPLDEDYVTFSDALPASGPVRRRKTSLRSNPLGSSHESAPSEPPIRQYPSIPRPIDPFLVCPRTPPPLVPFDPSRVTFHNLMPVFPRGVNPSALF